MALGSVPVYFPIATRREEPETCIGTYKLSPAPKLQYARHHPFLVNPVSQAKNSFLVPSISARPEAASERARRDGGSGARARPRRVHADRRPGARRRAGDNAAMPAHGGAQPQRRLLRAHVHVRAHPAARLVASCALARAWGRAAHGSASTDRARQPMREPARPDRPGSSPAPRFAAGRRPRPGGGPLGRAFSRATRKRSRAVPFVKFVRAQQLQLAASAPSTGPLLVLAAGH